MNVSGRMACDLTYANSEATVKREYVGLHASSFIPRLYISESHLEFGKCALLQESSRVTTVRNLTDVFICFLLV